MNGNRYILYTNAIIALLQGNKDIQSKLNKADWIGISVISQIEFLAFDNLSRQDKILFNNFSNRIEVLGINSNETKLIDKIISIRKKYNIKLPDAIIIAVTLNNKASLITSDKQLNKVKEIKIHSF